MSNMSDTYDAEVEKVLVNYGNLNYRLKQGTGEQTQHELMLEAKAKLSTLLRRAEREEAAWWSNRSVWLLKAALDKDPAFDSINREMADRLEQLQALLPRSPQEEESK